jgi:hypothetical protein
MQAFKSKGYVSESEPHYFFKPEPQRYAAPAPSTSDVQHKKITSSFFNILACFALELGPHKILTGAEPKKLCGCTVLEFGYGQIRIFGQISIMKN